VAAFYADESFPLLATRSGRAVLTLNRWDFVGLHARVARHAGIVVCSQDPDADRLATAIDVAVQSTTTLASALIRVNRPA